MTLLPPEFKPWAPIPRLNRDVLVTEKIDGTNAIIHVAEDGTITAGSRSKWLIETDNFGFAAWVRQHTEELRGLGAGYHYGEWYGAGIQRRYGLSEKRFALFNVRRWGGAAPVNTPPSCCSVVPVLAIGPQHDVVRAALERLRSGGSVAVPGFMRPEGIVVLHFASSQLFKVTLENDEKPKGQVAA